MKAKCSIGSRVALTAQHWLRPYENGVVVGQQSQALKKWLVQFDESYAGGGIEGNKLWCDEADFAEILAAKDDNLRRMPSADGMARSQPLDSRGFNGNQQAALIVVP